MNVTTRLPCGYSLNGSRDFCAGAHAGQVFCASEFERINANYKPFLLVRNKVIRRPKDRYQIRVNAYS